MLTLLEYKIVMIGDGNVGKSTLVRRLQTGKFTPVYLPTLGVEVHPLRFATNYCDIVMNVWDCAGQERFGGLRDGYYANADAAIVMFDVTNPASYANVGKWVRAFHKACPHAPIVLCGNKVDVRERKVMPAEITIHKEKDMGIYKYHDLSVKSNYNLEKPFLYLARRLVGHSDLTFVADHSDLATDELEEWEKEISARIGAGPA